MNVDLLNMTPREREVWDAGRQWGYVDGWEAGWAAADRDAARMFAAARSVARIVANARPVNLEQRERERTARDATRARLSRRWSA